MTTESTAITPSTVDGDISSTDVLLYVSSDGAHSITHVVQDPEQVAKRIESRILNADSEAALFGSDQVLHAQDYIGQPFQLMKVEWRTSDQGGLPFYVVLTILTPDGEILPMTTGARTVMLKVARADQIGAVPSAGWLRITKSDKPTEAGNFPLDIESAPAPGAF